MGGSDSRPTATVYYMKKRGRFAIARHCVEKRVGRLESGARCWRVVVESFRRGGVGCRPSEAGKGKGEEGVGEGERRAIM